MFRAIFFIFFITGCFISSVLASGKVVVIPMDSGKNKINNLVIVSKKGGDFASPVSAVESITDATADKPYKIFIGPGVYSLEKTLKMKPYVSIEGSGEQSTKLIGRLAISGGDLCDFSLVKGADNATLSNLTLENYLKKEPDKLLNETVYTAICNENSSPVIHHVTAKVFGVTNVTVYNKNSSPTMIDMTISAEHNDYVNVGVRNYNSSPVMKNIIINIGESDFGIGIDVYGDSSMFFSNVTTIGSKQGIHIDSECTSDKPITLNNSTINGGIYSYGKDCKVYIKYSSIIGGDAGITNTNTGYMRVSHSFVEGSENAILYDLNSSQTIRVLHSSLIGAVGGFGTGNISCVNTDNGVDTELNATCQ